MWTHEEALELCKAIEDVCPTHGCHVALTGGLLYKDGPRKDCDILFYRIRQAGEIDCDALFLALERIGLDYVRGDGWCQKATWKGKPVDCFFPEHDCFISEQDGYGESEPITQSQEEKPLRT